MQCGLRMGCVKGAAYVKGMTPKRWFTIFLGVIPESLLSGIQSFMQRRGVETKAENRGRDRGREQGKGKGRGQRQRQRQKHPPRAALAPLGQRGVSYYCWSWISSALRTFVAMELTALDGIALNFSFRMASCSGVKVPFRSDKSFLI